VAFFIGADMDGTYIISNYAKLYNPTNTSGGELKNATYVKYPVKPRGKGLRALLKKEDGAGILGIWGLLLQAATETTTPDLRGKLLNHKDEPASVEEIADAISFESDVERVQNALDVLKELGWIDYAVNTDKLRNDSVSVPDEVPSKLKGSRDNLTKNKKRDLGFRLTKEFFENLFDESFKPETQYEINTFNKLAKRCYEYALKNRLKAFGRCVIDDIADAKEYCKTNKKNRTEFIKIATSKITKELKT
jgi:hypothetical protein